MKKFLVTLALTAMCVFGFTACGNAAAKEEPLDVATATQFADSVMQDLASVYAQYPKDVILETIAAGGREDADRIESAINSYYSAMDEMGSTSGIDAATVKVEGTVKEATVTFVLKGEKRDADITLYYVASSSDFPQIMISPQYTFGEKMKKAGLNTLMGMGTVFVVLILIMYIIKIFAVIPKIEKSLADKKANKNANTTEKAVDNAVAQIIEQEELSDDAELVAVIAAAIAASEGAASTDGFVVRSIKRANTKKWQNA